MNELEIWLIDGKYLKFKNIVNCKETSGRLSFEYQVKRYVYKYKGSGIKDAFDDRGKEAVTYLCEGNFRLHKIAGYTISQSDIKLEPDEFINEF